MFPVLYDLMELLCSESVRIAALARSDDVSRKGSITRRFCNIYQVDHQVDKAHIWVSDHCLIHLLIYISLIGEEIESIARTDSVLTISGISNDNDLVEN